MDPQVLRKAIIQTSFKELYNIEREALGLSPLGAECIPTVNTITDLEKRLDSPSTDGWLVDPSKIHRGELLEIEVALEADPDFPRVPRSSQLFANSSRTTTICLIG